MKTASAFLLLCLCLGSIVPGCAGSRSGGRHAAVANPCVVEGDFDDIDAVVAGIIPRCKLVEFELPSETPDIKRYELRTLSDAPGTLAFENLPDGRIRISTTIGRFRETAREQELLRALARRITQLRGDVAVPISDP